MSGRYEDDDYLARERALEIATEWVGAGTPPATALDVAKQFGDNNIHGSTPESPAKD